MFRSSSVDPDMVKKCIKCLINWPDLNVPQSMKLTNFSVKEVANLSLHCLIQKSLPGKMLEGSKAHALLSLPPQPGCAKWLGNRAIIVEGSCDYFSLSVSAIFCNDAPKWAIIVRCIDGVDCGDDSDVDNGSEQAEELELSVLR